MSLGRLHALVLIEHPTRHVHLAGVTSHPSVARLEAEDVEILLSPPWAPRANAMNAHFRAMSCRCQASRVVGVTAKAWRRRSRGTNRESAAGQIRSADS
ncbi:hypothetical protein [Streptomyces sp. NBC_01450]|uniref:hypothetical protein n=1 Tax=Streptomyces sp. NBC_01450 TaxID=2903871 RepID=UPI002E32B3D7|nr:hypothetical protein [Streptomyces sp. NBC_01450]